MIKKVLFPLCSTFLTYQSLSLIKHLSLSPPDHYSWISICIFSILLNVFITGIFAFVGFCYPTNRLLPASYYRIKNVQKVTSLYNGLGVKYFKSMLLIFFWGKEKNRKRYFNGTRSGLNHFNFQTKQSEFGHLAAFLALLATAFYLLFCEHFVIALLTTVINIIGNFYPIVLQRVHRIQIERILKILKQKEKKRKNTHAPT